MLRFVRTARPIKTFDDGSTCCRFMVDEADVVRALDDVAGYYTTLHSLSPCQMGAIRRLAKKVAPVGDE